MLAVGQYDPHYVDAYYGPPAWKADAEAERVSLRTIEERAQALLARLDREPHAATAIERLRQAYLRGQLKAMTARLHMLQGEVLTFDAEALALYDVAPPRTEASHFEQVLGRLDTVLPGRGDVPDRYLRYRSRFVIPPPALDAVFRHAVAAGRRRTATHLTLPPDESFVVGYVRDRPWSGYNWYQGDYHSVIQVNTDLPVYIDRAVDLACHEGYPGHHVYNSLLERHLVRERGWPEFTVYPLFSPQSLIAEGSANYGIAMAFPGDERIEFERETLFPLAALPAEEAPAYYAVQALVRELSYAGNEAARRYLDGAISAAEAAAWLERYALATPEAARQRVRFFDTYRSYVINYNVGEDLVRAWIEREAGASLDARWRLFGELLASPRLPSALV